ncbi:hypothetical protein EDB84DRAFT_1640958 [Lactarius hengduanensis]|nr:hypothetical protein EDB84DRAFT_1640958 [Lactarius hengduanensis]
MSYLVHPPASRQPQHALDEHMCAIHARCPPPTPTSSASLPPALRSTLIEHWAERNDPSFIRVLPTKVTDERRHLKTHERTAVHGVASALWNLSLGQGSGGSYRNQTSMRQSFDDDLSPSQYPQGLLPGLDLTTIISITSNASPTVPALAPSVIPPHLDGFNIVVGNRGFLYPGAGSRWATLPPARRELPPPTRRGEATTPTPTRRPSLTGLPRGYGTDSVRRPYDVKVTRRGHDTRGHDTNTASQRYGTAARLQHRHGAPALQHRCDATIPTRRSNTATSTRRCEATTSTRRRKATTPTQRREATTPTRRCKVTTPRWRHEATTLTRRRSATTPTQRCGTTTPTRRSEATTPTRRREAMTPTRRREATTPTRRRLAMTSNAVPLGHDTNAAPLGHDTNTAPLGHDTNTALRHYDTDSAP